jgi:hypothetical protein
MEMKYFFWCSLLLTSLAIADSRKDSINGVELESFKDDDNRIYKGQTKKSLSHPIENVRLGIVNFDQKCNNDYKERRKLTDKTKTCAYHNDNLIETLVRTDLKTYIPDPQEDKRYILARHIYNRGTYSFYDLVQEYRFKNEAGQNVVKVVVTMLKEKEVSKYIDPNLPTNHVFKRTVSTFTLTEMGKNETQLVYDYEAKTDHWLLNKEVSVSQVFNSISKSLNDLFKTIESEAGKTQARQVASDLK